MKSDPPQPMVKLEMWLRPEKRTTPIPVFVRRTLKALLRSGGWRCVDVTWSETGDLKDGPNE